MMFLDDILFLLNTLPTWIASFILALIGFIIFLQRSKIDKTSLLLFLQIFILVALVRTISVILENDARTKLELYLTNQNSQVKIKISNSYLEEHSSKILVKHLKELTSPKLHHSSPKEAIVVRILLKNDSINLLLCQDDSISNEYWIFWRRYKSIGHIGKILITDSLLLDKLSKWNTPSCCSAAEK